MTRDRPRTRPASGRPSARALAVLLLVTSAGCAGEEDPEPTPVPPDAGPSSQPADAGAGERAEVGEPCSARCSAPAFSGEPFCVEDSGGAYCTTLCDRPEDCPAGFGCAEGGPMSAFFFCRREPTPPADGLLGEACEANSECGGQDDRFSFAEPFCAPRAQVCSRYCRDDCPEGFVCTADHGIPPVPETGRICLPASSGPPSSPDPADGARLTEIQTSSLRLRWVHSGPDQPTYDVFFGRANPPPLVLSGLRETSFQATGLEPSTRYFWQVVVDGAQAGPVWSFTTSDTFLRVPCPHAPTVRIGGQSYPTAEIGGRCWTAENLRVGRPADGGVVYDDGELEYFCASDPDVCGLYTWRELNGYTNTSGGTTSICPSGWRIPTRADWEALAAAYDGRTNDLVQGNLGFSLERDDRFQPRSTGERCNLPGSDPPTTVDCTRASRQRTRDNAVGWYWTATRTTSAQQGSVELYFADRRFALDIEDTPIEFGLSVRCVRAP